ncbi:hypothetical protein ACQEU6_03400 [Spirillospora sp. CA-108201]
MNIGNYAKAVVAGVVAAAAALGTALADDVVTTGEWVGVGLALFGVPPVTAVVPNARVSDERRRWPT